MRSADWAEGLAGFIERKRHDPFVWGSNDCLTFINEAYEAITGAGFCDDWLGNYTDTKAALAYYRDNKTTRPEADIIEAIDGRLKRVSLNPAPRGSLTARKTSGQVFGYSLGVCLGRDNAFLGANGLVFLHVEPSDICWDTA